METFKLRLPQGLPRRRNTPEMMAIAEGLWGHFDHLNAWKDWFVLVVGGGGGVFTEDKARSFLLSLYLII